MKEKKGSSLIAIAIIILIVIAIGVVVFVVINNNKTNDVNINEGSTSVNQEQTNTTTNTEKNVNNTFKYYFAFKNIDTNSFNKDLKLNIIYDFHGNELTTLPIKYSNLVEKYKAYYVKKSNYLEEYVETSNVVRYSSIHWGVNNKDTYLTMDFYNSDYDKAIEQLMNNHRFYISIGRNYYKTQLGFSSETGKDDIDIIITQLGNPNEIYIHNSSEEYSSQEKADYWLVYNYDNYVLAFNFSETSNQDRTKDSSIYIPPRLEDVYYIDGDSFKNGINEIKGSIYKNYYDEYIDIIIK